MPEGDELANPCLNAIKAANDLHGTLNASGFPSGDRFKRVQYIKKLRILRILRHRRFGLAVACN
jgi:hypothetical protein